MFACKTLLLISRIIDMTTGASEVKKIRREFVLTLSGEIQFIDQELSLYLLNKSRNDNSRGIQIISNILKRDS